MEKRYDDESRFTTPAHSRQTSFDIGQQPILSRLNQEYLEQHSTIFETDETDDVRVQISEPRHSRTVSDIVLGLHHRSNIPEEFQRIGSSHTVRYGNNHRTIDIVERSADDIIRETVREEYYRPYNNQDLSTSVVSVERRNASSHLNLAESSIPAVALANMKAEVFLEIPIIRENTYENPWSLEKFVERRPHLVRKDSEHAPYTVEVHSEVNLANARALVKASYFSRNLLDLLNISIEQTGRTTMVRFMHELSTARNLHFLLHCGVESGIVQQESISAYDAHENSSVYVNRRNDNEAHSASHHYEYSSERQSNLVPASTHQDVHVVRSHIYDEAIAVPTETIPIISYQNTSAHQEESSYSYVRSEQDYSSSNNHYQETVSHVSHYEEPVITYSSPITSQEVHVESVHTYHDTPAVIEDTIPIISYQNNSAHQEESSYSYVRSEQDYSSSNNHYQETVSHVSHYEEPVITYSSPITSQEVHVESVHTYHDTPAVIEDTIPIISYQNNSAHQEESSYSYVRSEQDYSSSNNHYQETVSHVSHYEEPVITYSSPITSQEVHVESVHTYHDTPAVIEDTIPIISYQNTSAHQEESSYSYVRSEQEITSSNNHYEETVSHASQYQEPVVTYSTPISQSSYQNIHSTTTYDNVAVRSTELDNEIRDTIERIQFPLHGTVQYVSTQVVRPALETVTEEHVVSFTDNSVTILREQLQTCEEKLKQKEALEASRRSELEFRAEQSRLRCEEVESQMRELTKKLDYCEMKRREDASQKSNVSQTVLEERNLRLQFENQVNELHVKLAECEQRLVHERAVQSASLLEMKNRTDKEYSERHEIEARFTSLRAKFGELENRFQQQQQAERAERLIEESKHKEIIERGQREIATLRSQLDSCERRVRQESIDISAIHAQEAELTRQRDYLSQKESDLQNQIQAYHNNRTQESIRIREQEERFQQEQANLRYAQEEIGRLQGQLQQRTKEQEAYAREQQRNKELLQKQSTDIKLQYEEINSLRKQLEESKLKERVYDEVPDENRGSPRSKSRGNLHFETFETTTVIQKSIKEYALDENEYAEIETQKKSEHIYEEPRTATVSKVTYAEADSTDERKRHLIDVSLPYGIHAGINVGKSDSGHKFEKNEYADVNVDLTRDVSTSGISSSQIKNMSKRNVWDHEETTSSATHSSAIPHVQSIPPPLNIAQSTTERGVDIIDESGQKHTAVKVDQTHFSPKETYSHGGLVERRRREYEDFLKHLTPSYSSSGSSHTFENKVSDNTVTSTEEIVKQEVTVLETVSSPNHTIATRPHVYELKREFELPHVPKPAPSPTPSETGSLKRPIKRLVDSYVSTEVRTYSSSGVPPTRPEPIYDNVATEEEPIYDTIADDLDKEEPIQRSWAVNTSAPNVKLDNHRSTMTDLDYYSSNGHIGNNVDKSSGEESRVLHEWDPRPLVHELYSVSYEPRVEIKKTRFVNIEGHVDVPSEETKTVAELEREWKQQYMRTREGRLQVFVSHCAEEAPENDYVLSGCDIDVNREERTFRIKGGPKKLNIVIRVPSNVFDKWRQSLASHSASSQTDAYLKPIPRSLPHINKRIVIIELGSCSIRGGILSQEPSLPQSFFPAIAVRMEDGTLVVGADAYAPEVRHRGEFICPIQAHNPSLERYTLNKDVVIACLRKVVSDLGVDPSRHEVLLSIPQNIPNALIGELATIALNDINFKGAAITRQSSLILYAYGVETGVVVDIGDRLNIVPIFDGYVVDSAIVTIPYGALQVREALRANLCSNNRGLYSFQSPVEKLILRYVMEQTSYVAENYAEEEQANHPEVNVSLESYNMPPGAPSTFNIDGSRFTCTEGFFNPKKWGLESRSLHQLVHDAVSLSPIDSRRNLMKNIFLAGGASLLPGLAVRLEQELTSISANTIHTQVHISPWRYNSAFLGAQKLAEKPGFEDMCITKDTLGSYLNNLSKPQN